jgi:23S rRNA pseudouridine2605 synthase
MRLHKLLAQHGIGSRREIEKWILAGRVLLNGKPALTGDRFKPGDRVVIDGTDVTRELAVTAEPQVLLYHKPQGQPITVNDGHSGDADEEFSTDRSVMESLPAVRGARWLVINTMQAGDSGLMVLTNDGQLADRLRRRADTMQAAYVARVLVPTPEFDIATIPRFVQYDDETVEFQSVEPAGGDGTNRWFRVVSPRAHRRAAVRALFESLGLKVSRVIQTQFGDLELPRDLPRGRHRELPGRQVRVLYAQAELEFPEAPKQAPPPRRAKPNARRSRKGVGPRPSRPTGSRKSSR